MEDAVAMAIPLEAFLAPVYLVTPSVQEMQRGVGSLWHN